MPTDVTITSPNQHSRYNVAQFKTNVRANMQLTGSNRVADSDIVTWLNEAQDEIAIETHWYRTSTYVSAVLGTKEYDLPQDLLGVEEVWWDPLQRRLIPMTPEDLEGLAFYSPDWRYAPQGIPIYYYINVNSALGMHPTPNANTSNAIFIVYSRLPAQVSGDTDFIYAPPNSERAVVNYACWRGSLKDATGEGQKRLQEFRAAWMEDLSKIKRQVEGQFEDDMCVIGEFGTMRSRRWGPRTDWENGAPIVAPG